MKPRDIVHALERLEMELEGERMAREDVAGQYMRYVEVSSRLFMIVFFNCIAGAPDSTIAAYYRLKGSKPTAQPRSKRMP